MRLLTLLVLLPLVGLLASFGVLVLAAACLGRRLPTPPCSWCGGTHAFSKPHEPCAECGMWHSLADGCLRGRTTAQVMEQGRQIQAYEEHVAEHGDTRGFERRGCDR